MNHRILFPSKAVALVVIAVAVASVLQPAPAAAANIRLTASLDGDQASGTCAQGSAGTGTADMAYDDVTNLFSWTITFSGLSGTPITAHFHGPAAPGDTAPALIGIVELISPSTGSATISETEEADLLADLWYINYHTSKCSEGEMRGQVTVVPVGGIAELPDVAGAPVATGESSGLSTAGLAGILAGATAGAMALGGVAWYARRRWV